MKFSWSNKDIENDIEELLRYANNESDLSKKSYCLKVIDHLNAILLDEELEEMKIRKSDQEFMYDITRDYAFCERYYKLNNIFYCGSYKSYEYRKELFNTTCELNYDYNPKYITHDEVLTLVHDFFRDIDEEFFKYFLEIFNNRYKLIRFTDKSSSINNRECDGYCIFADGVRKNYISVIDETGLPKLINLTHEIGHGILNLYNSKFLYNSYDEFLSEVGSLFFEIVINYELGRKINSYESALESVQTLDEYSNMSNDLVLHEILSDIWRKNKYRSGVTFYFKLKKEYGFSIGQVKDSINSSIENDGKYVIGYMLALELFHIYKQDKKSSIELLKKMINYGPYDSYEIINSIIPGFNNFEKEIDEINKTFDTELQKVKIK